MVVSIARHARHSPPVQSFSNVEQARRLLWSAELAGKYDTMTVLAWSAVFGLIALVPCAAWELSHVNVVVTWQGIASAAYLGVFGRRRGGFRCGPSPRHLAIATVRMAHFDVALHRNSMGGIEPIASAMCDRAAKCREWLQCGRPLNTAQAGT